MLIGQDKNPCPDFQFIMDEIETTFNNGAYPKTLELIKEARACAVDSLSSNRIEEWNSKIFDELQKQRDQLKNQAWKLEQMRQNEQKLRIQAERREKKALANDLAYRAEQQLDDNNRSLAFALAAFAHLFVDTGNSEAARVMHNSMYYNDVVGRRQNDESGNFFLPWYNIFDGHGSTVVDVEFLNGDQSLVTASTDRTIKIWDLKTGNEVSTSLPEMYFEIKDICLDPEDKFLAVAGESRIYIYEIKDGAPTEIPMDTIYTRNRIVTIGFGKYTDPIFREFPYLAIATSDSLYGYRIPNNKTSKENGFLYRHYFPEKIKSATFSTDSKLLSFINYNDQIGVCQPGESPAFEILVNDGIKDEALGIFVSEQKDYIGIIYNDVTQIWSVEEKKMMEEIDGDYPVARFTPEGKFVILAKADHKISIWEWKKQRVVRTFSGHRESIEQLAISKSKKWLASASEDKTAMVWEMSFPTKVREFPRNQITRLGDGQILDLVYSPDGKYLAWGTSTGKFKVLEITKDSLVLDQMSPLQGPVHQVLFVTQNQLATFSKGQDSVKIWKVGSLEPKLDADIILTKGGSGLLQKTYLSPKSDLLVEVYDDSKIMIVDLPSGVVIDSIIDISGTIHKAAIDPSAQYLAIAIDNEVLVRNLRSKRNLDREIFHEKVIQDLSFSPDGQTLVTASVDETMKLWDYKKGLDLRNFIGHSSEVQSVDFSSNGDFLVSCSKDGNSILWEVATGQDIRHISIHDGSSRVSAVTFSPNGKQLACIAKDKIRIWQLSADLMIADQLASEELANYYINRETIENFELDRYLEEEIDWHLMGDSRQVAAFAEFYIQKAQSYKNIEIRNGLYKKAAAAYRFINSKFEGTNPFLSKYVDLYLEWGSSLYHNNLLTEASEKYRLALELRPTTFKQLRELYQLPKELNVQVDFQRFIELPNSKESANAAYFFDNLGLNYETYQLYLQALRHNPEVAYGQNAYNLAETSNFDFETDVLNISAALLEKGQIKFLKELVEVLANLSTEEGPKSRKDYFKKVIITISEDILSIQDDDEEFSRKVGTYYNTFGWYQLLCGDFLACEETIRKAMEADPNNIYSPTNLAPALLFQPGDEKFEEAKELYRSKKDLPWIDDRYKETKGAFLADFEEFKQHGIIPDQLQYRVEEVLKILNGN